MCGFTQLHKEVRPAWTCSGGGGSLHRGCSLPIPTHTKEALEQTQEALLPYLGKCRDGFGHDVLTLVMPWSLLDAVISDLQNPERRV